MQREIVKIMRRFPPHFIEIAGVNGPHGGYGAWRAYEFDAGADKHRRSARAYPNIGSLRLALHDDVHPWGEWE